MGLLLLVVTTSLAAQPVRALEREIELTDALLFVPSEITVSPGEQVSLRLKNVGSSSHTFTLFAAGDQMAPVHDDDALIQYNGSTAKIVDVWVPPQETRWANFTAPAVEGDYHFVCMIIPHARQGMEGFMVVASQTGIELTTIAVVAGVVIAVAIVVSTFLRRLRQR